MCALRHCSFCFELDSPKCWSESMGKWLFWKINTHKIIHHFVLHSIRDIYIVNAKSMIIISYITVCVKVMQWYIYMFVCKLYIKSYQKSNLLVTKTSSVCAYMHVCLWVRVWKREKAGGWAELHLFLFFLELHFLFFLILDWQWACESRICTWGLQSSHDERQQLERVG